MCFFVRCEVGGLSKPFAAVWERAYVRFLASVCPQMRPQIKVQTKALATNVALVRLLSRVDQLVPLEFAVVKEFLATALLRAHIEPLAMGNEMLSISNKISEDLHAVFNLADVLFRIADPILVEFAPHAGKRILYQIALGIVVRDHLLSEDIADYCVW